MSEPYRVGTWVDGRAKVTFLIEGTGVEDSRLVIYIEDEHGEKEYRIPLASFAARVNASMAWRRVEAQLWDIALEVLAVRRAGGGGE